MGKVYQSFDELIGATPLIELKRLEQAEELPAKILAKLEYFNPAGSVKDRVAKAMLDDAENRGVIGEGSVIRTAVIFFYLSNEGVSILENAAHIGLPVPQKLKDILEQLHNRSDKEV